MNEAIRASLNRSNAIRLTLSVILALILWGWVSTIKDPRQDRQFLDLPITTQNMPTDFVITTTIPRASIRIDGPESEVTSVTSASFAPYIDLGAIGEPGLYTLDVEVGDVDGLWHTTVSPGTLTVNVEQRITRSVTLETELDGDIGNNRRIEGVVAASQSVTIEGAESDVNRVTRVVLPIQVENQTLEFVGSFTPEARDASNAVVSGVTVTPGTVSATVRIAQRGKTVSVLPNVIGSPGDGYRITNQVANPQQVVVDGPTEVLNRMIAVQAGPVDVQGQTGTVQVTVPIYDLPEGVTVIEPADGQVAVQVNIASEGVRQDLPEQAVSIINLAPGLVATIDPGLVTVTVTGPSETIAALESNDIIVQIDLAGLTEGTYSLEPTVSLPQRLIWVATDPIEVTVRIQAEGDAGTSQAIPAASTPQITTPAQE